MQKTTKKARLAAAAEAYMHAARDYGYARGLRDGQTGKGHFLIDPNKCLLEYAAALDAAELEFYNILK